MRRRLIVVAALITAFVLAVPGVVLYCAAFTQAGLQFMVNRVPARIAGVRLTFENVRGTLAEGVQIERLEIDQERVYLRFDDVSVRLHLGSLLWQTIRVPQLSVRNIFIRVKPHKEEPPSAHPHFLPHGIVIRADKAHADAVALVLPNGQRLDGTQVDVAGFVRRRTIRILSAALTMGTLELAGESELAAADSLKVRGAVRATVRNPGQPPWIFSITARGDLDSLPLTVGLTVPFRADFRGLARNLTSQWTWSGKAKVAEFDLRAWGGGDALGLISGALELAGDASGFSATGSVTPAGLGVGAFDAIFEGSYSDEVLTAKRIELRHRTSGAQATAAGTVISAYNGPRLDLKGNWREFRWPLLGTAALKSAAGDYVLSGTWPYEISASGVVMVPDFPNMPIKMQGQLAKDAVSVRSAEVNALDGEASVSGEVRWAPKESWAASGNATAINPGKLRPDLPGQVNFGFSATGQGFSSDADFTVELKGITGKLRGLSARGDGKLVRGAKAWLFQDVRLGLGQTNLALDGKLAEQLSLKFAVDATDMSLLAPESRGELHAHGTLGGTRRTPALTLSARGQGIHHNGMSLESIETEIDFDMEAAHRSKISLHARNFSYRQRTLTALNLSMDGTTAGHALRLDAKAVGLALQLRATGGLVQDTWRGQLSGFNVEGNESLHLELEAPIGLFASADRMHIDKLCLHGQPGRMCLNADWTPARWSGELAAQDLPMSTLTAGLTPSIEYRGRLNVTANASGAGAEPLQGSLRADLVDAKLLHRTPAGKLELVQLGTGIVAITASHAAIDTDVRFDAGEVGTIKGRASIARTTAQWQNMPLQGEVHAQTAELGYITLYFPEIDKASGKLDMNLALAGTLGTPLIEGTIKLANTELDFFQVNLSLRQTELEAKLHDNAVDFAGSAHIGQGALSTRGSLAWRDSLPYGQFHLEGSGLRVADIPEAQIDASPNLDFQIAGRQIRVVGNVKVPYAKIVPADVTDAVRSSSDEVLVGKEPDDPNRRFEVTSEITLSLGDKVSIDTLGLKARLTGIIALRSGFDNVTNGTGELSVEDGKYSAYGRQLDIQRGRLIFNGGVIEDPGIDIRAVKVFPDVTAGVNVRGSLRQPRISYFSDPSLTQSQILSLLLAGGSLESVQNRQNGAASQLLAQGGAIIAQQFGSKVGIQDVGLETDLSNDTSLVLGRYLSTRLYVSYGVSLTQQLNTVKLRYTLSDRWTIKTEAGQARGADLVYTIQK